jgi:hypothetical protein
VVKEHTFVYIIKNPKIHKMMNLFSLLESVLFLCFGISFIMVLLMFYHFKKRLDVVEKKNETLGDICKTMVKQIENIKYETSLPNIPKDETKEPTDETKYKTHTLDDFLKNLIDKTDPTTLGNIDPVYGIDPVLMYSQNINVNNFENGELDDVESVNGNDDLEENENTHSQVEELEEFDDNTTAIKTSTQFDDNNEPVIDTIHVTKLEETEPLAEDDISSQITENTTSMQKQTRNKLQKMNVQMLKTIVIRDGLSTDPTKMKKTELIQLILDNEEIIAKDLE